MRIKDISVDGFGIFHDIAVEDLPPGLTLFEGQNEAGKSTLMSFIRAVLFGFENRKSGCNRYEPLKGGRHGGAITLVGEDGGGYRIERHEGGVRGRLVVTDFEGRRHKEDVLQQLLYGTSKVLYQNVFAFGLTELQRLDTLQADEVSHHIYTAGMGTGSVAFADVMSTLEEEQGHLFKPGGKKPTINALLSQLDRTQHQIRDLQAIPEEYYSVQGQLLTVDDEVHRLEQQLDQSKRRVDWLETVWKARPDWENLVAVRKELEELPAIANFPEGGIERLQQIEQTVAALDARLSATQLAMRDLEDRRSKLQPDPVLLQHQERIQALAEDREHVRKVLEHLPTLRVKVESHRTSLDEVLTRLGDEWSDDRLARLDTSIPVRERIRGFRDRLATTEAERTEASKQIAELEQGRRARQAELDRLQRNRESLAVLERPTHASLEEREKALRQWTQHCHEQDLATQHQRDAQDLRVSLADQRRAHQVEAALLDRQTGFPTWVIIAVGLLFGALAAVAVHVNQWVLAGALIVAGIVTDGLLLWWRDRLQNERQSRLDELNRQYQIIKGRAQELYQEATTNQKELHQLGSRMAALSQLAVGYQLQSREEVEEALRGIEAERRLLERRQDIEVRIQEEEESLVKLLEERHIVEQAAKAREQAHEEAIEAWGSFSRTLEITENLTPDGALELVTSAESAKVLLREWQESAEVLSRGEEEVQSTAQQVNDLLTRCGRSVVALPELTASLLALKQSLDDNLHMRVDSDRLTDLLAEKQRELEAIAADRAHTEEQRHTLLALAAAHDAEDFRRRAETSKRFSELDRQRRQLEIRLEVHAGSPKRCEDLMDTLAKKPLAKLERELREATTGEREKLVDTLEQKLQDKGRLHQQMKNLEQNDKLSANLLEYRTLVAQLDQQAQRWAVRSITRYLLDKARQVYERERQPAVLKEASKFFRVMTGGQYRRVVVPFGETKLQVETNNRHTRGTERLSRGTAEQLYLAMRLALVREYAKHAGPLPLVIDDILVNFDPGRARAAIEVLKDVATFHQVLFFTCHPHVSEWFKEQIPDMDVRPLPKSA